MAPGANPQNTNTLHAPFPRTTTASRPLSSSSSSAANANRRSNITGSDNAPNSRPSAPRARSIVGSMAPPATGGTGRRNERFDRLFYTSPLPRSISREYNNLRASHGTTIGGAAPTPATTSTGKATTNVTAAKTTTTNIIAVPSALRRAIGVDETSSAGAGIAKPSPVRPPSRNATLTRFNGSKTPSKAVTDSDDPLSAPNASSISLPSPSRVITRHTNPSPLAPLSAIKSTASTKTSAIKTAEVVAIDTDPNSDDEVQDEAQDVDGNNKETTSEEEQPTKPTTSLRTKRAHSPPRSPVLPKKLPKTAATVSPIEVRNMRSMRKSAQAPLDQEEETPQRPLLQNNHKHLNTTLPRSPSPVVITTPQPPHTAPAPAKKSKAYKKILPGFYVPPGILDKTGSLWNGKRRTSRRISLPPNYSTFITPSPNVRRKAGRGGKSLGASEARIEKEDPRESIHGDDSESLISIVAESSSEQQSRPEDEPESFHNIEQWEPSSDEYVPSKSAPPTLPLPQQSSPQPQGIRKLRKSLGGKAKRYITATESESDVVVPGIIGGRIRRRSIIGTSALEPPASIEVNNSNRGAKEPRKDVRNKTGRPQSGNRQSRERETPSTWKLQQMQMKRSLRVGNRKEADEGRMNRVLSAGIEESIAATTKTPTTTTKKPTSMKKTPALKKEEEDWVVEETPPQAPITTTTATAPTTITAKGSSTGKKKAANWIIDETPQPLIEKRVTRGSVSTGKKKKSTRVGVGLTRGFNAEFEFSDDE